jgi:hypothetical protein
MWQIEPGCQASTRWFRPPVFELLHERRIAELELAADLGRVADKLA